MIVVFSLIWQYGLARIIILIQNEDIAFNLAKIYIWGMIIIHIINIIYSISRKKDEYKKLSKYELILKVANIPLFLFLFLVSLGSAVIMVVPAFIFMSPLLIAFICIISYLIVINTSLYGINALIRLKSLKMISNRYFIIHFILHLMFVLDVISSILVYRRIKKIEKKEKTIIEISNN